jgi:hypothetical protein
MDAEGGGMRPTVRRTGEWTIILALTLGLIPGGAIAKDAAPAAKKGTASGGGGSWTAHGAYGTAAYGGAAAGGVHYYGGTYATYHPPVTVNHYYGTGCYNCGGWPTAGAAAAGVAVGVVAGAAVASANNQATASNAYSAGYAGGAANTAYAMNAIYPTLPSGCTAETSHGTTLYVCNHTWFKPSFGANGVYYRVVPAP